MFTNCQPTQWITKCRGILMEKEKAALISRAKCWENVVNHKTKDLNNKLNIQLTNKLNFANIPLFEYKIYPEQHLSFLIEWKGLKIQKMIKLPSEYSDFEFKAKNWLCGRRAPNYGSTLFPDMINKAKIYSEKISRIVFAHNEQLRKYYQIGIMYGYLSVLCSTKISLSDRSKKVQLLYENSIKSVKSVTTKLLKEYIMDDMNQLIPLQLVNIANYFATKCYKYTNVLISKIKHYVNHNNKNNNNNNSMHMYNQVQPMQTRSFIPIVNNNNNVHNNINCFQQQHHQQQRQQQQRTDMTTNMNNNQLRKLIMDVSSVQKQQQCYMNQLQKRVLSLENILKNQLKINNLNTCNIRDNQHYQRIHMSVDNYNDDNISNVTSSTNTNTNTNNNNDDDDVRMFNSNRNNNIHLKNNNNIHPHVQSIQPIPSIQTMQTMQPVPNMQYIITNGRNIFDISALLQNAQIYQI